MGAAIFQHPRSRVSGRAFRAHHPETDTPGAKAANVHQYVDLVVSEDTPENQSAFRRGLERFDRADGAGQVDILREGGAFFERLKELTVGGYYKSEVGMKKSSASRAAPS